MPRQQQELQVPEGSHLVHTYLQVSFTLWCGSYFQRNMPRIGLRVGRRFPGAWAAQLDMARGSSQDGMTMRTTFLYTQKSSMSGRKLGLTRSLWNLVLYLCRICIFLHGVRLGQNSPHQKWNTVYLLSRQEKRKGDRINVQHFYWTGQNLMLQKVWLCQPQGEEIVKSDYT